MKVLIAEDDRDQLVIRERLLRQSGFEPIAAIDNKSALRAAEIGHPACAVVDLNFPTEESGLRLIRELKRSEPKMHIVVLTGANPARLDRLPERDLINDVVEKGSPAAKLIQTLRQIKGK